MYRQITPARRCAFLGLPPTNHHLSLSTPAFGSSPSPVPSFFSVPSHLPSSLGKMAFRQTVKSIGQIRRENPQSVLLRNVENMGLRLVRSYPSIHAASAHLYASTYPVCKLIMMSQPDPFPLSCSSSIPFDPAFLTALGSRPTPRVDSRKCPYRPPYARTRFPQEQGLQVWHRASVAPSDVADPRDCRQAQGIPVHFARTIHD